MNLKILILLILSLIALSSFSINYDSVRINNIERDFAITNDFAVSSNCRLDSLFSVVRKMENSINYLEQENNLQDSIINANLIFEFQRQKEFNSLQARLEKQNQISFYGALILLVGLFLEVIGAVLLSSENLSKSTIKVRPYTSECGFFEMSDNHNLDAKIITLQFIGTFLLVIGFILQFVGTVLVVSSSLVLNIVIIFGAIIIVFLVMIVLINRIGNLAISSKIKSTLMNLKGIVMFAMERKIHKRNRLICEECFGLVKYNSASVRYKSVDDNHVKFHELFIGHTNCIEDSFLKNTNSSEESNELKFSLESFLNEKFPSMENANIEKLKTGYDEDTEYMQTMKRLTKIRNNFG